VTSVANPPREVFLRHFFITACTKERRDHGVGKKKPGKEMTYKRCLGLVKYVKKNHDGPADSSNLICGFVFINKLFALISVLHFGIPSGLAGQINIGNSIFSRINSCWE